MRERKRKQRERAGERGAMRGREWEKKKDGCEMYTDSSWDLSAVHHTSSAGYGGRGCAHRRGVINSRDEEEEERGRKRKFYGMYVERTPTGGWGLAVGKEDAFVGTRGGGGGEKGREGKGK